MAEDSLASSAGPRARAGQLGAQSGMVPNEPYALMNYLHWQLYTSAIYNLQFYSGEVDPTRYVAKRRKLAATDFLPPQFPSCDKASSFNSQNSGRSKKELRQSSPPATSDVDLNSLITFRPQTDVAMPPKPSRSDPAERSGSSPVYNLRSGSQRKRTNDGAMVKSRRSSKKGGSPEEREENRVPHPHAPCALAWKVKNGVTESQTHIGHVFPEVLEGVFRMLDLQSLGRAAQVCKRVE